MRRDFFEKKAAKTFFRKLLGSEDFNLKIIFEGLKVIYDGPSDSGDI